MVFAAKHIGFKLIQIWMNEFYDGAHLGQILHFRGKLPI